MTETKPSFQRYCWDWLQKVFGKDPTALILARSKEERLRRFGEEAIELLQAGGLSVLDVVQLTAYVYARPVGHIPQEIGGTVVTLAAVAEAFEVDMYTQGWVEIERCYRPEVMDKIRRKQVSKQLHNIGGVTIGKEQL